ncbi:MAG: SDR family oxidoreductase [Bacteroidota bacterium]
MTVASAIAPQVDLQAEAVFERAFRVPEASGRRARSGPVLLTGATGFVGAYLLRELLVHTSWRVRCLVRCQSVDHGRRRLIRSMRRYRLWQPAFESRIDIVPGDLSKPDLGLAPTAMKALGRSVGVVVHSAVDMNYRASYAASKAVNVRAVETLLHLCVGPVPKSFHFLSSIAVFQYEGTGPDVVDEATPLAPCIHRTNFGYGASKWVSDVMVQRAIAAGLDAYVHRLGYATWDTHTRVLDRKQALALFIESAKRLGLRPRPGPQLPPLEVRPIDALAADIVRVVRARPSAEQPRILHHWEPQTVGFPALIARYLRDEGMALQDIELAAWMQQAATRPRLPVHSLLAVLAGAAFDRAGAPRLSASVTNRYLAGLGRA